MKSVNFFLVLIGLIVVLIATTQTSLLADKALPNCSECPPEYSCVGNPPANYECTFTCTQSDIGKKCGPEGIECTRQGQTMNSNCNWFAGCEPC